METQVVLYIYSFPSYLKEQPRVKIGRTSGSADADPTQLAWQRMRAQVRTSHPEEPYLLSAIKIPDERVESIIHSALPDLWLKSYERLQNAARSTAETQ